MNLVLKKTHKYGRLRKWESVIGEVFAMTNIGNEGKSVEPNFRKATIARNAPTDSMQLGR